MILGYSSIELIWFVITAIATIAPLIALIWVSVTNKHFKVLFTIIPIVILSLVISIFTINDIKSKPITVIPAKFVMLSYIEAKPIIYIWSSIEKNSHPVTIVVPWTENNVKQLQNAKNRSQAGVPQVFDKQRLEREGRRTHDSQELLFYDFDISQTYIKKQ
jgi:glucan phosphoethanolaminetransferase (alkaline phosphatase superfamily)